MFSIQTQFDNLKCFQKVIHSKQSKIDGYENLLTDEALRAVDEANVLTKSKYRFFLGYDSSLS